MTQLFRDEAAQILRFGGGRNTRASEDRINPLECADGENFSLDPGNGEFKPRKPFDVVGTVPNSKAVRGFVTLRKTDGSVSLLVQGGEQVYEWDGSTFSSVGTVSPNANIRGTVDAFWPLADKVLISDLSLAEDIHEWDGTTFQETSFLQADGSTPFPDFRCKYIVVEDERALYGNIYESASPFPHLLVASELGNYTVVSASDRPSDALGADAPWFLPTPQLKPINGMAVAFNVLAISQDKGAFEKLAGSSAKDYELQKLHPGSGATGTEAMVSTGNDIIYGAAAHIESLESTDKFGDVEWDDLSFKIYDDIENVKSWTVLYNRRVHRVYCIPEGGNVVHVLHTDFIGTELSPWSKWTTQHPFSFQPTASMLCYDPADGLEYVFMGDSSGNVYRLEGAGSGDGGTADIAARRESVLYQSQLDAQSFNVNGWLAHRKDLANTAMLTFKWSGKHVHDVAKSVALPAAGYSTPYNGEVYYGGQHYYGVNQQSRRVHRTFATPGQSENFQVEVKVTGQNDFAIPEVGFRYDQAKAG